MDLCRTIQNLLLSRFSSLEPLPRLWRPAHSPQIITTAPIGHPCTLGRLSVPSRSTILIQEILKGSFRGRGGSCLTGRIAPAKRIPVIFMSLKPRACARGFPLRPDGQTQDNELHPAGRARQYSQQARNRAEGLAGASARGGAACNVLSRNAGLGTLYDQVEFFAEAINPFALTVEPPISTLSQVANPDAPRSRDRQSRHRPKRGIGSRRWRRISPDT
jgi:hypothetical protein